MQIVMLRVKIMVSFIVGFNVSGESSAITFSRFGFFSNVGRHKTVNISLNFRKFCN